MSFKKSFLPLTELFFGLVLFSLIFLEIGVRIISPLSPFTPLLPLRPISKRELRVNLRGISPVGYFSTNRWGMRGDEPPKDWQNYDTVVTIGGSTTKCYHLDDHKTWPYLLQEELKSVYPKVWVGNGGLPGQSTRAHLIFMRDVIPKIKPKTVVFLVGVNDLSFSIEEDQSNLSRSYDKASWRFFLFQSRLFQILYQWKLIFFNKVVVETDQGHGNYEPLPLVNAMTLPEDLKSFLTQLPEYRENLKKLIESGRASHVRMIFMTQPLLFEDSEFYRKAAGSFYWIQKTKGNLSAADYWRLLDVYNQELLDVCRREKVECLDLASQIPHDPLYFYDSCHFTEKGAMLVARNLAEYFKAHPQLHFS